MKRIIYFLLIILFIFIFSFSAYKITDYYSQSNASTKLYEEMQSNQISYEPSLNIKTDIPICVDFEALKSKNDDIIAWLYCEDTPINYPVMKSKDNEDYLSHLPDGTYNFSGSLFLDCFNSPEFSDFTSIIYGHNMKNGTMFGTLANYRQQEYYDSHKVMYLLTPSDNYTVELLSGFETNTHSDVYSYPYENGEKKAFIEMIKSKSDFKSSANASAEDNLIIFSTCATSTNDSRYVVIGKLNPCA